jgi:hypothetical protein
MVVIMDVTVPVLVDKDILVVVEAAHTTAIPAPAIVLPFGYF